MSGAATTVDDALAAFWRGERVGVLATLVRDARGDVDAAEEALAEAVGRAVTRWAADGVPQRPAGWVLVTARRCLIDAARQRQRRERVVWGLAADASEARPTRDRGEDADMVAEFDAAMPDDDATEHESDLTGPAAMPPRSSDEAAAATTARPAGHRDDRLALLFTCCHPALADAAQVGLALRTIGGLTAREIARAYLEPEATTAQRLVRATRKIRAAGIRVAVPADAAERAARLPTVRRVLYLLFNEGYAATEGDVYVREPLCDEAIRLGRLLLDLAPDDAESLGLLALMLAHHARRSTRLDADGAVLLLEAQDRSQWDAAMIREADALLTRALARQAAGPLQVQAAIALLHATAPSAAATDWAQVAQLYGRLRFWQPSPVVELNAAVALAMVHGPAWGLAQVEELAAAPGMAGYHLLPAARADLLRRSGRLTEAAAAYAEAMAVVRTTAERRYLAKRLVECGGPADETGRTAH